MLSFLVMAVVHAGVCVLLYLASKHHNLVGHDRGFRNHLSHLSHGWLGLVSYFAVAPLVFLPSAAAHRLFSLSPSLNISLTTVADAILLYGGLWVAVYLRRAILEVETTRSSLYSPAHAHPFVGFSHIAERSIRFLTDDALLPAALGSQSLLFLPAVLGTDSPNYFRVGAYLLVLIITAMLLFRLGLAYRYSLNSRFLLVVATVAGAAELLFPLVVIAGGRTEFAIWTGGVKAVLGLSVAAVTFAHARRLESPRESNAEDDFLRLAVRLSTIRRLHSIKVTATALLGLFFWYVAVRAGMERITDSMGLELSPLARHARFLLIFLLVAAGAQLISYLSRSFGYHLKWEFQTATGNSLAKYSVERVQCPKGWRQLSAALRGRQKLRGQTQVILVHGIFSDSESTWGLLPAFLCDRPDVAVVHMLDYMHNLFTLGRGRLDQLSEELGGRIAHLIDEKSDVRTVVIGHSLGGLLLLKAVAGLAEEPDHSDLGTAFSRLGHVGVVGAPLLGSVLSAVMWPWPIWRQLSLRSSFIRETLEEFSERVPRPGSLEGVLRGIPIVSFLFGRRDRVIHSVVRFFRFGSYIVETTAAHDLGWVSERADEPLKAYDRMLDHADGRVRSMERIARLAAGNSVPALSVVIGTEGVHDLSNGRILHDNLSGPPREGGADASIVGQPVLEVLARLLGKDEVQGAALETAAKSVGDWLAEEYGYSGQWRQLRSVGARGGHRVYLLSAGRVGLCAVFRETLKQTAIGPHFTEDAPTKTLAEVVAGRFLGCDEGAVAAMFCESCGHAAEMDRNAGVVGALVSGSAAIDSEGSYYAVYDLSGHVGGDKNVRGLAIHMGASGVASSWKEMYFAAFDLVGGVPLLVEQQSKGRQCCLWRVALRREYQPGEQIHIRWSYRRRHCMSREGDLDFINVSQQGTKIDSARLSLFVVGTVTRSEAISVTREGVEVIQQAQVLGVGHSELVTAWDASMPACDGVGLAYTVARISDERPELASLVTLRTATAEDARILGAYEPMVAARVPAGEDVWRQRIERFPDGVVLSSLGEMIVGYATFLRADFGKPLVFEKIRDFSVHEEKAGTAFLLFCGVLSPFRRRGIGEALVTSAMERARQLGCDEMQVVAAQESRDFFMRLGFRVLGDEKDFIKDLRGLRMGTSLATRSTVRLAPANPVAH